MFVKRVGIIGAGPSGLAVIKACLEEGLEPSAFEREGELGGVWVYRGVDSVRYPEGAAVYKCLKTNTSKAFFRFTDFPSPTEWTPFVSHDKCLKYFQDYANHFGLSNYISFNSEVVKVCPADDYETTGRWRLCYRRLGEEREDIFDAVVLCSGFYEKANSPKYPGLELFDGEVSLANAYRENTKFADKKVLVVGSGISAGDIAIDLSFTTKQAITFISTHRGFKVSAMIDSHGWPIDTYLGRRYLQSLTPKLVQWFWTRESNKRFRMNELGLYSQSEDGCHPTSVIYNDDFASRILCGKILPKPKVERFTKDGAIFTDGTKIEDVDAILFCAGYSSVVPFADKVLQGSTAERDLYLNMIPVHLRHHTLGCVGFFKNFSVGSPITVIDMQSRWVARIFSGAAQLPSEEATLEEIHKRRQKELEQFGKELFGIHAIKYMDHLATLIGCYPFLTSLFLTDPLLAIHMFFGPVVPASYRLVGPYRWNRARNTILNSWKTTFEGTRRKSAKQENGLLLIVNYSSSFTSAFLTLVAVVFLLLLTFVIS